VFAWIDAEKAEFPITKLCQYLHVSASGFYASRGRPESVHVQTDRRLRVLVRAAFDASRHRYGSPRIHEDLIEQAVHVSRKRVVRVMQEEGLRARLRKRYKSTTMSDHDQPVAANLLDRRFDADAPNRCWVGDTTEFVIGGSGKLYLAVSLTSSHGLSWAGPSVRSMIGTSRSRPSTWRSNGAVPIEVSRVALRAVQRSYVGAPVIGH
jgi:putative transposase